MNANVNTEIQQHSIEEEVLEGQVGWYIMIISKGALKSTEESSLALQNRINIFVQAGQAS